MCTLQFYIHDVRLKRESKMAHSGISAGAKGRLVAVIGDEVRTNSLHNLVYLSSE